MNRRQTERGMTLIIVLVLIVITMGAVTVFFKRGVNEIKLQRNDIAATRAIWNANALLEQAKHNIETSTYNNSGNVWLINAVALNPAISNERGTVAVTQLVAPWYEIRATSVVDRITKTVMVRVRDRDLFSKYLMFTYLDNINIGSSSANGLVHTNRYLNMYYGNAKFYDLATAVRGFGFYSGATWDNTTFYEGYNPAASTISWPNVSQIAALKNVAQGPYQVTNSSPYYNGFGNFNTELTFVGDQVRILARATNGNVLADRTLPLPPEKIIYVEGDVTSLKGDLNGQVSVATIGKVDVTGPIKYVDGSGNSKYYNVNGGWTVEEYQVNPAYTGTSVLGVMAQKDVTVTPVCPYNMEMMGAYFSLVGNWHCDLTQTKGNLRYVGSMVTKLAGWRYNGANGRGWSASGLYTYDRDMIDNPPPHFLEVETTAYRGWEVDE